MPLFRQFHLWCGLFMHEKRNQFRIFLAVVILLCLTAGIVSGATVTESITYQGKLADDSGSPVTGTVEMTFNLYESSSGGSPIATDTRTVDVANGLFTTQIAADRKLFDGRPLWLGIAVEDDDEMTPLQEIRPVPYALSLRPGAWIVSDETGLYPLTVRTTWGGVALNVSTTGADSSGIFERNSGKDSVGLFIWTSNTNSDGIWVITDDEQGDGVVVRTRGFKSKGLDVFSSGDASNAVNVTLSGGESVGISVTGTHSLETGVSSLTRGDSSTAFNGITYGDGSNGATLRTSGNTSDGISVYTGGDTSNGITIETDGDESYGIDILTHDPDSIGVNIETRAPGSNAIRAKAGGYGTTAIHANSTNGNAIYAIAHGVHSYALSAYSDQSYGIYADGSDYGLYTPDKIRAAGSDYPSADVAEFMPVDADMEPGTVMVIGPAGTLQPSSAAYDTRVAGIVSTEPAVSLGAKDAGNPGEAAIAVAGRVPCKVDASYGAIHAGDLLTTSDTPGYAMKATNPKIGTILGKAMGTLESGTGTIEVLVTLQ